MRGRHPAIHALDDVANTNPRKMLVYKWLVFKGVDKAINEPFQGDELPSHEGGFVENCPFRYLGLSWYFRAWCIITNQSNGRRWQTLKA